MPLLEQVQSPADLKALDVGQLETLAEEIRAFITSSVSQTGGHLASNLGVVELTIALHRVFDFAKDRLVWDVGHQCYAHKILTGRREGFAKLRQAGGVSGFPDPDESPYDTFRVGHAGTSIATAIGLALGARHRGGDERIVAFVGDASIVNGTNFEALNNLGLVQRQLLIVLNDNSMAIDVTPGALASYLARVRLSHTYEDIRKTTQAILEHLPVIGKPMGEALENFKKAIRMQISPSRLFESLNVPYFGPVDGHDIESLIELFGALEHLDRPALLHVYTRKGKGFAPADTDPRRFHSTGPFEIRGQDADVVPGKRSFTAVFSEAIVDLARSDKRVVAITAAMPDGTGLAEFREQFPERFYDVGIAESAAVDIAAGLARKGMRPFVCVYSTFLQRGFDHIFQDVALQHLPVVFCIDRAGLVGNDGPTHHGLMDIGFLRMLPSVEIVAPACEADMRLALAYALQAEGALAIRYPRDVVRNGRVDAACVGRPFESGRGVVLREGRDSVIVAVLGPLADRALEAADRLEGRGLSITVVDARFVKPLDPMLVEAVLGGQTVVTLEDHYRSSGFGSAVLEAVSAASAGRGLGVPGRVVSLGVPDVFVPAARRPDQLDGAGLSAEAIAEAVLAYANVPHRTG